MLNDSRKLALLVNDSVLKIKGQEQVPNKCSLCNLQKSSLRKIQVKVGLKNKELEMGCICSCLGSVLGCIKDTCCCACK